MSQWDSLLTDFSPSLLRVILQPYLIQVILNALGSYPFPLFCRDISFAFSTNPGPLETAEVETRYCCAKQTCWGGCSAGASQVHTQSDCLALKDTVFEEQRATRISGHSHLLTL